MSTKNNFICVNDKCHSRSFVFSKKHVWLHRIGQCEWQNFYKGCGRQKKPKKKQQSSNSLQVLKNYSFKPSG